MVCFDSSTSFRKEIDSGYKKNRTQQSPELRKQFELSIEACKAIGVCSIIRPGYEADDLIASLAMKAQEVGHQVRVVSPDKDIHQIVTDNIVVINHKSASQTEVWGISSVLEKTFF